MITSKSNLFKSAVATLAAIPLAAAATFTPTGSAVALEQLPANRFSFVGAGNSQLTLTNNSLIFDDPKEFDIQSSFGIFAGATLGTLNNISSFDPLETVTPFFTLSDGSFFKLTSASYLVGESLSISTPIEVILQGIYTDSVGKEFQGQGFWTTQAQGNRAFVVNAINNGGITESYSGIFSATASVPEPATLLGLGIVAAGMAVSRRRKTIPQ